MPVSLVLRRYSRRTTINLSGAMSLALSPPPPTLLLSE